MIYFIILIILIVIIRKKNKYIDELESKISILEKQLKGNFDTVPDITKEPEQKINIKKAVSKQKNEIEQKNTLILITGSILIILAAIVFLTTAWHSISDIAKTIILFLFVGIFLGASKIANHKFKLEKASKTFFYIAMAYIPICLFSISIFGLLGDFLSINGAGKYLYLVLSTISLAIIYYFVSKKTNSSYLIYGSILSQLLSVILFTLLFEEEIFLVFINLLLYNLLLMLLTKNSLFKKIYSIIPAIIAIISLFTIFEPTNLIILNYILIAINFLILELKESSFIKALTFNIYLFAFGFGLIANQDFNLSFKVQQFLFTAYTLIIFFLQNLLLTYLKKNNNLIKTCHILSCTSIIFIYAFSIFEEVIISSIIIGLICILFLALSYAKTKNFAYKYIAYAFTNILLIDINHTFFNDSNLLNFIPALTTIGIIYFEKLYPSLEDTFLPIYLGASQSIALLAILDLNSEASVILSIAFVVYIIFYNYQTKKNQLCNIVPLAFLLPNILDSGLSSELEFAIMLLLTVGISFASLHKGKINIFTIFSGIYLFFTCDCLYNEYITHILLISWASIHTYFLTSPKDKDIFKILTTIFITSLYYTIAYDLNLLSYTLFTYLGCIVAGIYIIKNVLTKYFQNMDTIEYIFWISIYASAIFEYANHSDGIIFSLLILGIIFYSYVKKFGSTFLASIIALLVNAFALTKEFWFNIPWWIYLLSIGGTLIGFAIKNEARTNEEKISLKSVLKNIKDSCEK